MLGKVFKAYDIRGVYPDPLNERMAWQIGYGCAEYLLGEARSAGETAPMMQRIVVGRDMRKSSPALAAKLIEGATAFGASVLDVGMVDTSFIAFAVNHFDCAGGVMTTASHNPPQYNGFKICKRKGKPVGEGFGLGDIRKAAAMADPAVVGKPRNRGQVEERDLWKAYADHVLSFLDLGGKRLKVVIDASNGMAGTMVPRVFGAGRPETKGLEIVEMNFENSKGVFVHEPNPLLPSALAGLQEAVVREKADLGVCFDGDADRCVLIDERGRPIGCDHATAWLSAWFLKRAPGAAVAYDLRSSKAVEEDIRAAGGTPVKCRVGHVFMKALLAERDGVFGGELSGHFYFRDNFYADSGAIAMAAALTALAHAGKPLSKCIAPVARYAQSGETNFHIEDKDGALSALLREYSGRGTVEELDGVTIDCFASEGWWCNVRKSNTEPLLRLNLEAKDEARLRKMLDAISPTLGERAEH